MSDQPPLTPDPEDATRDLSKPPADSGIPKPPAAEDPSISAPPPPPPSGAVPPPPPPSGAVPPPPPPSGAVPPPPAYDAAPPPPPPPGAYLPPVGPVPARSFSAIDAIGYGWKGFTNNLGAVLLIVLVVWAINFVVNAFIYLAGDNSVVSLVASILALIVSWIIAIGLIRAALAILDGRSPEMSDLLSAKGLLPYVVASILVGLIVAVGTLLCIIPGLIAAFLLYFFAYAIVDGKTESPIDALKISFGVVKENVGELLVFIILAFLVNLAGLLLCGIGLIATVPTTAIAAAYAWRYFTRGQIAPQP